MILFFVVALLSVLSSLVVILHRNPVYSALALVNTLFLLAVGYGMLDAQVMAFFQITVYAGAIVILFLFVIMLLSLTAEDHAIATPAWGRSAGVAGGVLGLELLLIVAAVPTRAEGPAIASSFGSIEALGGELFTRYLLAFELTSILLLVAVVGAVVLARRKA